MVVPFIAILSPIFFLRFKVNKNEWLSSLSTYIISNLIDNVKFFPKFFYFFFDTQHLENTIDHNGPQFPCWSSYKLSLNISFLICRPQQVHQVSSVGAEVVPIFKGFREGSNIRIYRLMIIRIRLVRLLSHSLVILYQIWSTMSSLFRSFFHFFSILNT